jgi:hypothetical protein
MQMAFNNIANPEDDMFWTGAQDPLGEGNVSN